MDDKKLEKSTTTSGISPGYEKATGAPGSLKENNQHESYWVLTEEERQKGFIRPLRDSYIHDVCGTLTKINSVAIVETYARDPKYYGSTFCVKCSDHFPVVEFTWDKSNDKLGS